MNINLKNLTIKPLESSENHVLYAYSALPTSLEPSDQEEFPKDPFWMVVRIGYQGSTKADAMPTVHWPTYEEAHAEAKRLASKYPNHPRGFAVVEVKSVIRGIVDTLEVSFEKKAPLTEKKALKRAKVKKGGVK
jgi:hypothetical protein